MKYSIQEVEDGPPGGSDVAVRLTSNNLVQLGVLGQYIAKRLEKVRGTVDATAWTSIGIMNPGWDEFLNFRLEPEFFSTDLGVIVNHGETYIFEAWFRPFLAHRFFSI